MPLPEKVPDPGIDRNLRNIDQRFPIGAENIKNGAVTDAKLASANNSVYRLVFSAETAIGADAGAGKYIMAPAGNVTSGSNLAAANLDRDMPPVFEFDDADYTVSGLTQKLRLRAQVLANATAPAITFTFGLYPVTVAGGADVLAFTIGTVVTGSTVAIASPSASTATRGTPTADFTVPADGVYSLGVVTSGTIANNSLVFLAAQLQVRNT
jgi:hypothetical protein